MQLVKNLMPQEAHKALQRELVRAEVRMRDKKVAALTKVKEVCAAPFANSLRSGAASRCAETERGAACSSLVECPLSGFSYSKQGNL